MQVTKEGKESVLVALYVLYRMNVLHRHRLRDAVRILTEDTLSGEQIEGFIVDEIKKIPGVDK